MGQHRVRGCDLTAFFVDGLDLPLHLSARLLELPLQQGDDRGFASVGDTGPLLYQATAGGDQFLDLLQRRTG